jgi:SpoVK/Ycf46/Vps4 family AAA+-type ATPase
VTHSSRGVYFFDEFDAIGSQRGLTNDVGEMRRVLNSFLLMLEEDTSNSLVVAATNQPSILDPALFRRFDDVLEYHLPDGARIAELLKARLGRVATAGICWRSLADTAVGLSYADVAFVSNEVLKSSLIDGDGLVNEAHIRELLSERKGVAERLGEHRS